jgi:hypothetical protein
LTRGLVCKLIFISCRAARVVEIDEERLERGAESKACSCTSGNAKLGDAEQKFIKR